MSAPRQMRLTRELAALCHRDVPERPIPDAYDYYNQASYERAVDGILAQRPHGPFWIFAYGSLMWKPEVETSQARRGMAHGWHRAFSLHINNYRATPEQLGYMMCLDRGGNCDGLLLRVDEAELRNSLGALLFRELGSDEALEGVRWIEVGGEDGPQTALTFYAAPVQLDYYRADRPLPEIAHALARACGHWGSGADYLHNTVSHLEQLGIHDEGLWQLQELVAQEIEALYGR
jgi:cation transport protein ChaC